jgi:hypothetical protein
LPTLRSPRNRRARSRRRNRNGQVMMETSLVRMGAQTNEPRAVTVMHP